MNDETQVAVREETQVASPGALLGAMLELARDQNFDAVKFKALAELQITMEDRQAERFLTRDLQAIQSAMPPIPKRGVIDLGGKGKIPYALLPDVMRALQPLLDRYGMTISRTMMPVPAMPEKLIVRCILRHPAGATMSVDMIVPVDSGPGRNSTQAHMSSETYGYRRGVKALCNIRDEDAFDDDGESAHLKRLTEEQVTTLVDLLKAGGGNEGALLMHFYAGKYRSLDEVPEGEFLKLHQAISDRNQAVAAKRAKES